MKNSEALALAAAKLINRPHVMATLTKAAAAAAPVVLETAIVIAPAALAGYGAYCLVKKLCE